MRKYYFFLLMILFAVGCARVQEPFKVMWGSSTKALEDHRGTAAAKMYECFPGACHATVIEVAQKYGYEVFINEPKKHRAVIITTAQSSAPKIAVSLSGGESETVVVNTTEIAIFITPLKIKEAKVEVVSLSTTAQEVFAERLFEVLDKTYSQIKELPL